jgi:hypothetical protein
MTMHLVLKSEPPKSISHVFYFANQIRNNHADGKQVAFSILKVFLMVAHPALKMSRSITISELICIKTIIY